MGVACLFQFGHNIGEVRLEPFFRSMSSALIAEHPALIRQIDHLCDRRRRLFEVINIVWLVLYYAFRHAVRGKKDRNALPYILWKTLEGLLYALCQSL